ncbi:protein EARLY FLOWERING 3-like [Carya illinoinensis]|uniref:Uncharacterized protein n=1 Tax=Carya illinoinensis TaxID=32201 RepID=A0A8T1N8P2_CARIL|nr:protein EARLY FLOWERING 3-like [Carya illinoinensis]XP_042960349.1 protein EARLY FLOWERING 3-like [Carya illinoinensis]KAG6626362.1 hypothetical protein CIPAW_15G042600 [Carya illinoinensis]
MKRGKDDEKIMGPMFPRLHVNDTEKGGPRAPPRNKMALYEQLSIPSQRFNPAHTNNTSSPVYPASSSQGNGLERNYNFPLHVPPSIPTHQGEKLPGHRSEGSGLNNSLAQLEQRKKVGDEDDFIVPVFVQSGTGQSHGKTLNSNDREKIASFSPTYSGRSTKHQNACDKNPKLITSPHINLGQEVRCESEGDPRLSVSSHSVLSATDLSTREKFEGLVKETKAAPDQAYQDCPATNISSSYDFDASLQQEFRTRSQPVDTGFADSVRDEDDGKVPHPRSITHLGEANSSPNEPNNGSEYYRVRTNVSLQVGNVDGSDDVSETSMVDSISGFDISPDDVVGIIGQKHFWKARKAIVNQQRVFAVQVFELHRLIKVQQLIAGSPHILLENGAFLGKPSLKDSLAKKLPSKYVLKPPSYTSKCKDDSEKENHKMERSAENAVGKTSVSSTKNGNQPSNCGPYLGNSQPAPAANDNKMGTWSFHQSPGHQWLVPVVSPSEGLIYKPYPGPGFMGTACGGYGPFSPAPLTGNFMNSAYGVPTHPYHQGIGNLPNTSPVGHTYFPTYGMPVMHPAMSGSGVEQVNQYAGPGLHGQTQISVANSNMQHQSSCNMPNKKNGASPQVGQFQAAKDGELQGSTGSSPCERPQGVGTGYISNGGDALPLFPMAPVVPEAAPQLHEIDQTTRVIKVVPHNPRTATESAARIFQSIQEERKQYDTA